MKTYKSEDGSYLAIDKHFDDYPIAWYFPDEGEFGAYIGECESPEEGEESDESKKARWEIMVADTAAKPFSCGKGPYGYSFESEKQAKLALIACNTALLNGGAPMPDWAVKATAAKWKPPKGWKP